MTTEYEEAPRPGTEEPEADQVVESIVPGVYDRVAPEYYDAGWPGVIPLNGEGNPPTGYTGYEGKWPTREQVAIWCVQQPNAKVALRAPDDIIGIDVDAYDGKNGASTLDEWELNLGALPRTIKSTSRMPEDSISGIRWFRVPPGRKWKHNLGHESHVDIIQRSHRFGVVWPSVAHRTGRVTKWYGPDDAELVAVPKPVDAAELPDEWRQVLDITDAGNAVRRESASERLDLGEIFDGLNEGERDEKLYRYACSLRSRNPKMAKEEAYALVELWGARCTPPFPAEWCRRKVDQAWKHAAGITVGGVDAKLTDWAKKISGTRTATEDVEVEQAGEVEEVEEPFILSSHEVRNRPKLLWQIDGVMPERSLWQAFGPTGSYKTFVIIDMLNQLANGPAGNFLGHDILTDGPGLCCMVLGEGGGDIAERQEAWCLAHPELTDENTFFVVDKDINLLLVEDVNRLGEELVKVSMSRGMPWRCIVFDTQADHLPTGDERNEATFSELKPKLLHISRQLNASVGLVHHTGHNEERERGSSRQRQMLDVVMNIDGSKIVAEKVKAGPKFEDIHYITRSIGDSLVVAQPTDAEVMYKANEKLKNDAVALVAYMEKTQAPDYILDDLKKGLNWGRPRVLAAVEMAHGFIKSVKAGRSYTFTLVRNED